MSGTMLDASHELVWGSGGAFLACAVNRFFALKKKMSWAQCAKVGFTRPARARRRECRAPGGPRKTDDIFSALRARRASHGARAGAKAPGVHRPPAKASAARRGRREITPPLKKTI